MRLADIPAQWTQLVDDEDDRLTVVEIDDALGTQAPFPGFDWQLAVAVDIEEPDPQGQPYDDEHEALLDWQDALVRALGDGGRLVASITSGGVREFVAYVVSADVVEPWATAPPAGFGSHTAAVQMLHDPGWLGLREIAGLLGDDEEPLRAPEP